MGIGDCSFRVDLVNKTGLRLKDEKYKDEYTHLSDIFEYVF